MRHQHIRAIRPRPQENNTDITFYTYLGDRALCLSLAAQSLHAIQPDSHFLLYHYSERSSIVDSFVIGMWRLSIMHARLVTTKTSRLRRQIQPQLQIQQLQHDNCKQLQLETAHARLVVCKYIVRTLTTTTTLLRLQSYKRQLRRYDYYNYNCSYYNTAGNNYIDQTLNARTISDRQARRL